MKPNYKRGVYFLANNRVYEPTVAFLNSFREYNEDIPLCFIPFDDDVDKIVELHHEYAFTIYCDRNVLRQCDAISKQFHGYNLGAYRKLAIWEGDFDEFAYIDVDTVVLSNIDFAFEHLKHTDIFASHSNIENIRQWVWKDTIFDTGELSREQINFAANTGFIVSTRSTLGMKFANSKLPDALKVKDHMTLGCMEQPLLNYLIVTSGKKYGSLFRFEQKDDVRDEIKLEMWAGTEGIMTNNGKLVRSSKDLEIFLLHWAGPWLGPNFTAFDDMPLSDIWKYYRFLRTLSS